MITADKLHAFAPRCDAEAVAPILDKAAMQADCNTPLRLCHFLAQWHVESQGFTRVRESLNYTPEALVRIWPSHFTQGQALALGRTPNRPANQLAIANICYGGRMGNNQPGDGARYIGRSWTQLTGRANYKAAGDALGLDLVDEPELAETLPGCGELCAWYWTSRNINAAADRDDIEAVTKLVNGGLIGLPARQGELISARAIFGS